MSEVARLGRRLRESPLTCEALVRGALEAIRSLEPRLHAFISVTDEIALSTARERDRELRAGRDRGPLHGIPIVYKDCIDTAGVRTTVGAHVFRERIPQTDAAVVQRLGAAGALMLGKTNLNELAAGGPGGYNKFYGSTRNPWNLEHESGGSSSGTGAAVAAGICAVGLGTDSGGSIRGPASHMGVVGLRPTIGRVDMRGVFPRASSFDICGPLGACVRDVSIVFDALADADVGAPRIKPEGFSLTDIRLGIVENYSLEKAQPEVANEVSATLRDLERSGATLVSVRVDELEGQKVQEEAARILVYEFARDFGETYRGVAERESFGPIVHSDMKKARDVSRSAYESALSFKSLFSAKFREALRDVDAIATPTMPNTAPSIGKPDLSGGHRRFTIPVSLAGLPAISLPCGLSAAGLPIGLQLIGSPRGEHGLLAIAEACEVVLARKRTHPPLYFDLAAELSAV